MNELCISYHKYLKCDVIGFGWYGQFFHHVIGAADGVGFLDLVAAGISDHRRWVGDMLSVRSQVFYKIRYVVSKNTADNNSYAAPVASHTGEVQMNVMIQKDLW